MSGGRIDSLCGPCSEGSNRLAARYAKCEFLPLEERLLLSGTVFTVDTLDDTEAADGLVSLREAIIAANTNASYMDAPAGSDIESDMITFDELLFTDGAAQLDLLNGQLDITGDLAIEAPAGNSLTINANSLSRIFDIPVAVTLELTGLTLIGGYSDSSGGAIRGYLGSIPAAIEGATVILDDVSISNCTAATIAGAIISDNLVISNSEITASTAGDFGGIYGYDVTLENSIVSYNKAGGSCGGVFGSTLALINSVIVGNVASSSGGGVYGAQISIVNSTITANSASSGAGIYVHGGHADIANSIVADNVGSDIAGDFTAVNTILGIDPVFVVAPDDGGDGWLDDPLTTEIDESANNIYGDLHLQDVSPAVNFGNNALALDSSGAGLIEDFDALARIVDTTVDAGAYEYQSAMPTGRQAPTSLVDTTSGAIDLYDGVTSLAEAVWFASTNQLSAGDITFDAALAGETIALLRPLRLDGDAIIDASALSSAITIDAGGGFRAMRIGSGYEVAVNSLIFTNGSASFGGAIYAASSSSLTLTDVSFTDNLVGYGGGAIYCDSSSTLILQGCDFVGNSSDSSGGAIAMSTGSSLSIDASVFDANSAGDYSVGGAISLSGGDATITDSEFTNNTAGWGGGAIDAAQSQLTIVRASFMYNSALQGGAFNLLLSQLELDSCFLGANSAADNGGGIYLYASDLLAVTTIMVANSATFGGGVYQLSNSSVELTHSDMVANSGGDGGAIGSYGSDITVNNSIVTDNSVVDILGSYASASSIIGTDASFAADPDDGGDGWGDNPATTEVDESANDFFGDLNYRPDSPAIDAGDDLLSIGSDLTPLTLDYAGSPRISGDSVDIGAFEYQYSYIPGDANGDDVVDLDDFIVLKQNYGTAEASWEMGDFNGDGTVDLDDFIILKQNYGSTGA